MNLNLTKGRNAGFTLVELVIVIVVLGILSAVAIPRFFDFTTDANEAACKGALGGVRSAIANSYAASALPSNGGVAAYPTIGDLTAPGVTMSSPMPENPYLGSAAVRDASGETFGSVLGTEGWAYDPTDGEFWANSSGSGENGF